MVDPTILAIIAIPVTAFLTLLFQELLPSNVRFSLQYGVRRFKKVFRDPSVEVTLIGKTSDLTRQEIDAQTMVADIKKQLGQSGHKVAESVDTLSSHVNVGATQAEVEISVATSPIEKEEELEDGTVKTKQLIIATQVQLSLKAIVKYHSLAEHFLELSESQQQILSAISSKVPSFQTNRVLTCKLNTLYELTGLLSEYNIGMLSASFGKTRVDLAGDKIVVYSDSLTGQVISFLRKMIVMYY